MRKTAFAKVMRQLRRVVVIAGVAATLGVTAVPAQADPPSTFPDQALGQQSSWSGPSFGMSIQTSSHAWFGTSLHRIGHKLVV